MRRAQALFLLTLGVAAGLILAHSSHLIPKDEWVTLLLLAMTFMASGMLTLIQVTGGNFSFTAAGLLIAFLIGGPDVALWAAAMGTLVETLVKSGKLGNMLFNVAQTTVGSWIAFQFYTYLGGEWGSKFDHPWQILAMSGLYILINAVFYGTYLQFSGVMTVVTAMRMIMDRVNILTYIITMMVGIMVGHAYLKGGLAWGVVSAALAYMLHITLREYYDTLERARSQAQQLETVFNATQGAMVLTDREGVVRVANRQSGVLFRVPSELLVGQKGDVIPELRQIRLLHEASGSVTQQVMEMARGPARFVQWYRAAVKNQQGELHGHIYVLTDVTALKEAEEGLRRLNEALIKALTAAIDARDSYTHGHSSRVAEYSVSIARRMGLAPVELERIGYAALLHDIGKLGVGDQVLNKRGPLSPDERALMMQHPIIGAEVLEKAAVLKDLIPGIRWHHEWVAGGGYPDGLAGETIPLDARIIGVADAFDAMTTDRQYRAKLSIDEALRRIEKGSGTQFDSSVASALLEAVHAGEITPPSLRSSLPAPEPVPEEDPGIRPVHGKELSIFYQLSREDYTALDLHEMLQRTVETFHQIIGPHSYLMYLTDPVTGEVSLAASTGLSESDRPAEKDMRLVEQALSKEAPVVVRDIRLLDGYRPASAATKSEVVIPLATPDDLLGALVVEAAMPDLFHRDEIYLLDTLSSQVCALIRLGRYHERLTHAANHDALTGVFNHSYFHERLAEETERAARSGRTTSVAVIDVAGLREINEQLGHQVGDAALRGFGQALRNLARPNDVAARLRGDEFALILPDTDGTQARREIEALIGRLLDRLSELGLALDINGWGVSTYPVDGVRPFDLVLAADRAMRRPTVSLDRTTGPIARQPDTPPPSSPGTGTGESPE